jgi:heat shock protein HslJ
MKKISLVLIGILVATCTLTACSKSNTNPLDGTSWSLQEYRDASGELVSPAQGAVITALLQADVVSGIAACNNYSGEYSVEKKNLTFGPTASTKKMCVEPGIMELETAYLTALTQVTTFKLTGTTLEMFPERGDSLLVFKPAGQ